MLFPQNGRLLRNGTFLSGFTLTELMVGAVIFIGVLGAAYKVFTGATKAATESSKNTQAVRQLTQFNTTYRQRIENTTQLPSSTYDGTTASTVLEVKQPAGCIASGSGTFSWGLVPLPGKDVSTINAAAYQPDDPSTATVDTSTHANDAVILVSEALDSGVNYMKLNHPTTIQSGPTDTIEVATINGLSVGDFAVISDGIQRDLIRITKITQANCLAGGSCYLLSHDYNVSYWNKKMIYNFGSTAGDMYGAPMIFKVNVETYAFDSAKNTIVRDTHLKDDHFNPQTKVFGTKGLAFDWETVTPNVERFQILYISANNDETRTPVAGIPNENSAYYKSVNAGCEDSATCTCTSQIGLPNLRNIKTVITFKNSSQSQANEEVAQVFNPMELKVTFGSGGGTPLAGCNAASLYTTIDNGSGTMIPNPVCNPNSKSPCLCSDRCPNDDCNYGSGNGGNTGPRKYGGGGSG